MMDKNIDRPPTGTVVPCMALSRTQCATAIGVSPRKIDELIAGRRGNGFPVVHLGSKPVIPVDLLRNWLAEKAKGDMR